MMGQYTKYQKLVWMIFNKTVNWLVIPFIVTLDFFLIVSCLLLFPSFLLSFLPSFLGSCDVIPHFTLKTGIRTGRSILNQFLCREKDLPHISSLSVFNKTFLGAYRIQKVSTINDKQYGITECINATPL
jgi:hypothetical protein